MRNSKPFALTAAAALVAVTLTGCGETESTDSTGSTDSAATSAPATVTVVSTVAEDDDDDDKGDDANSAPAPAPAAPAAGASSESELPEAVTGYTDEAREEMADDGISEADVERVLAAARNQEAGVEVEWDDDGYWEIEFQDIDIDITPEGMVLEADR